MACEHKHLTTEHYGHTFLVSGEYDDDIIEVSRCLDCGEEVEFCDHPASHFEYETAFNALGLDTGEAWAVLVCDVCGTVLDADTCVPADFYPD